jgi:hypothetical protein
MKILITIFSFILTFSLNANEIIEDRLNKIENRLDKIEELLQPLQLLQGLNLNNEDNISAEVNNKSNKKGINECIKITDLKNRITEKNTIIHNHSYIIEYTNSCSESFTGYPTLTYLDKDGFNLHEAVIFDAIRIPANGIKKAKGQEMIMIEVSNDITEFSAGFKSSLY